MKQQVWKNVAVVHDYNIHDYVVSDDGGVDDLDNDKVTQL